MGSCFTCHELGNGVLQPGRGQGKNESHDRPDQLINPHIFFAEQPGKKDVVKEALRVVKKGGAFSFQDMFSQKALYGDMDEFVRILKAEGISEVHYIGNLEKKLEFIPGFVTTPWMIRGMGILYGKK